MLWKVTYHVNGQRELILCHHIFVEASSHKQAKIMATSIFDSWLRGKEQDNYNAYRVFTYKNYTITKIKSKKNV